MCSRRRQASLIGLTLAVGTAAACGAGTAPADTAAALPANLAVVQGGVQIAAAGTAAAEVPTVLVQDADGRPLAGVPVTFTANGGWVVAERVLTDADGRAATVWHAPPQPGAAARLRASAGSLTADFILRTTALEPGRSYPGAEGYVELVPGAYPVIISVPHGGSLAPAELPDRTGDVTTARDAFTIELAHAIADAIEQRSGRRPSLVISHLHRRKLDPNRDVAEAAQSDPSAQRAWREYHGFIEAARAAVAAAGAPGIYIDLHGHGHEIQRVELGYRLTAHDLALSDATLNSDGVVARSSLRALVDGAARPHAELVRGRRSLGSLLESRGFPAVPSATSPQPGLAPYFSGGYSTARHASQDGALISGFQLEANRTGLRDTEENRRAFAAALAESLVEFARHWHAAPAAAARSAAAAAVAW